MAGEPPSRVTFDIEPQGEQVKLSVVHEGFPAGSKVFDGINRGWPLILSSLKSFVENGRVLQAPWHCDQAQPEAGAMRMRG